MFHSLKRLAPHLNSTQVEHSLFSYLKKASGELSTTSRPKDLDSLVRIVSAISSFKYPAFNPTMKRVMLKDNDKEWIDQLLSEADSCPQSKALKYFRTLSSTDMPDELMVRLLKRMSIQSKQDIDEFIAAVRDIAPERITGEIRNWSQYSVKNAIHNNCRLSTYNRIFDLVNSVWNGTQRHLLPTRLRQDLVAASWSAMMRLDIGKEGEFIEAIRWLSFGESVTGRKEEVEEFLGRMEVRAKGFINHETLVSAIVPILGFRRGKALPEPLDSISQLLVRKLNVRSLSVPQLMTLVEAINSSDADLRIVDSIIPQISDQVTKSINSIPSRSLPAALQLIINSTGDSGLVAHELEKRGHELSGVELVRLINGMEFVEPKLIHKLFAVTDASQETYMQDLIESSLLFKDKIELMSSIASSGIDFDDSAIAPLCQSLRASVKAEIDSLATVPQIPTESIVKIFSAGDSIFEGSGLIPSALLVQLLSSEKASCLSIPQTLALLRATGDADIAQALFAHAVSAGRRLSAMECLDLVKAAVDVIGSEHHINESLKLLVPQLSSMEDLGVLLRQLPSPVAKMDSRSRYNPSNQLRETVVDRLVQLAPSMTARAAVSALVEMGRLDFSAKSAVDAIVSRLMNSTEPLIELPDEASWIVHACRQLKVYNSQLLDSVSNQFLGILTQDDAEAVVHYSTALMEIGNKNEYILSAAEKVLKDLASTEAPLEEILPVRITLINTLAKSGVFSPLFQEQLRAVMDAAANNVAAISEEDWVKLFEVNLSLVIEAPPKIKAKYVNDVKFKQFFEDHCSFAWYAHQEKARDAFIYSTHREQIAEATIALGWDDMRTPELGKEVYHVDLLSSSGGKVAIVTVPEHDELAAAGSVKIIVGDSMTKIKHLQLFGYKVVPVWLSEWRPIASTEERKACLLRNSNQVVFALGARRI